MGDNIYRKEKNKIKNDTNNNIEVAHKTTNCIYHKKGNNIFFDINNYANDQKIF